MKELEHFKAWLHSTYWEQHFPEYIKRKYGNREFQRVLPIFADLGVPLVGQRKPKKLK
jgi:hypothetical protein